MGARADILLRIGRKPVEKVRLQVGTGAASVVTAAARNTAYKWYSAPSLCWTPAG